MHLNNTNVPIERDMTITLSLYFDLWQIGLPVRSSFSSFTQETRAPWTDENSPISLSQA